MNFTWHPFEKQINFVQVLSVVFWGAYFVWTLLFSCQVKAQDIDASDGIFQGVPFGKFSNIMNGDSVFFLMKISDGYYLTYRDIHAGELFTHCSNEKFRFCAYISVLGYYFIVPDRKLKYGETWEAMGQKFSVISSEDGAAMIDAVPVGSDAKNQDTFRFIFSRLVGVVAFAKGKLKPSGGDCELCFADREIVSTWISSKPNLPMLTYVPKD